MPPGLHAAQARRTRTFGLIAFLVLFVGEALMMGIVNEEALDRFLLSAGLNEARRAEAALAAMAASVRMRVVELETEPDPNPKLALVR